MITLTIHNSHRPALIIALTATHLQGKTISIAVIYNRPIRPADGTLILVRTKIFYDYSMFNSNNINLNLFVFVLESPYGDVSGLPDPYLEQLIDNEEHMNKPQPHLSMSYDESLESGYSTPNSRTRRIIREIIV